MKTTPSRFNGFIAQVDPNLEGRPTIGPRADAPATTPQAPTDASDLSVLERRHPAVVQTLRLLWGFPELNQYFEKVYSGRDRSLDLEPDAMAELMLLASVHRHVCPHKPAAPIDDAFGVGRRSDVWKPARLRR